MWLIKSKLRRLNSFFQIIWNLRHCLKTKFSYDSIIWRFKIFWHSIKSDHFLFVLNSNNKTIKFIRLKNFVTFNYYCFLASTGKTKLNQHMLNSYLPYNVFRLLWECLDHNTAFFYTTLSKRIPKNEKVWTSFYGWVSRSHLFHRIYNHTQPNHLYLSTDNWYLRV